MESRLCKLNILPDCRDDIETIVSSLYLEGDNTSRAIDEQYAPHFFFLLLDLMLVSEPIQMLVSLLSVECLVHE